MEKLFFDTWDSLIRTAAITIMSYVLLIFLLRGFGKRTLSKMNAFDLVVTVALGSTLASIRTVMFCVSLWWSVGTEKNP